MPIQLAYEDNPPSRRDAPAPTGPTLDFDDVARIASPADNCAIATQDLAAGSELRRADGPPLRLSVGLLEGHRFALTPIAHDAFLLSWGEPFGKALRAIAPGEWLCNAKTLHELRKRQVASALGVLSIYNPEGLVAEGGLLIFSFFSLHFLSHGLSCAFPHYDSSARILSSCSLAVPLGAMASCWLAWAMASCAIAEDAMPISVLTRWSLSLNSKGGAAAGGASPHTAWDGSPVCECTNEGA
eukprot:Transcript_10287.p1 GENE.Transcript_10287~~Transcript_10287.p1  ORF type:complete len:242 (-),score=44.80 Transcript_10287:4-729(-)